MIKLHDKEIVKVGEFKIGLVSSCQIIPLGDIEMLGSLQKELDVDILISDGMGKSSIVNYEGKHLLNPGSLTGAFSPLGDNKPSFILLAINGDVGILYHYDLDTSTKAVECSKIDFE
jgi:vacuolar protein sorting-associated protein 29